jgi:uncharacterized membrane protein YgdD (TMEM256/DUF423 family)
LGSFFLKRLKISSEGFRIKPVVPLSCFYIYLQAQNSNNQIILMNLAKWSLFTGALLGFSGVIAGAMGAHALEAQLDAGKLASFETAARYQMYMALAFLALGALSYKAPQKGLLPVFWTWLVGVILFSGSIYLLVLTPIKVGLVTPIGGLIMIIGWAILAIWALRKA